MVRALLLLGLFVGAARADVISEEQEHCQHHAVGDACEGGTCVASTCSHPRYGAHGRDGTTEYPCVICKPGSAVGTPGSGTSASLIAGIAIGVAALGAGVWLAFRRKPA